MPSYQHAQRCRRPNLPLHAHSGLGEAQVQRLLGLRGKIAVHGDQVARPRSLARNNDLLALESGLRREQIIISCKTSRPRDLITVYRDLSAKTEQPLHLGLTEAGMGMKGQIWSAASLGVLLYEGIGDTIRISLTPKPGGDRREEVYAACELLQALGLRSFAPSVTACPGCGRTTSTTFQELAEAIQGYIRDSMPIWKTQYEGVEEMTLAVMGCIVNGPGESKAANIGISLPGTGEAPRCPVYIDGQKDVTLEGTYDELAVAFQALVDNYIAKKYPRKTAEVAPTAQ